MNLAKEFSLKDQCFYLLNQFAIKRCLKHEMKRKRHCYDNCLHHYRPPDLLLREFMWFYLNIVIILVTLLLNNASIASGSMILEGKFE